MIQTQLVKNDDVFELLQKPGFQEEWKILAAESLGFTQMQEANFLTTWYQYYCPIFDPILIFSRNSSGEMVGLIALAWHKEKQYLVHAGSAEYHGWLAKEALTTLFLKDVLNIINKDLKIKKWSWNWMPPGLQADALIAAVDSDFQIIIEEQESPIWNLEQPDNLTKLKKSRSLKSKFNRYKKRGAYRFEIIEDPEQLKEVIQIAKFQCDIRREAMNNRRPFAEDPFKIDFVSSLLHFQKTLHVSALWLDDQLLAYHMGVQDEQRVTLGMITYDPSESKQSPGTLIILELATHLSNDGYKILDLTPGTNSYKDRFANFYETLYRPAIYFSKTSFRKAQLKKVLEQNVKKALIFLGMEQPAIRKWKTNLAELPVIFKQYPFRSILNQLRIIISKHNGYFLYEVNLKNFEVASAAVPSIKHQNYVDLMDYNDHYPFLNRRRLLIDALHKFSKGDILFSQNQNQNLNWLVWMKEVKDKLELKGSGETMVLESKAKILYGFYKSSSIDEETYYENLIALLFKIKNSGEHTLYILINEKNKLPQKIEKTLIIKSYKVLTSNRI